MKNKKQAELNNIKTALLNLTIDAVLKYYFTTEGSEEVLADFLSVAINIPLEEFEDIEVLNPFLSKEHLKDKDFIVDIRIKTKSGKIIHVEMQMADHLNFGARIVAYNGRLFGSQLKRGEEYTTLKPVYSIIITNFDMFPNNPKYRDVFKYTGEEGDILTDLTQIHILQLPKLPKKPKTELENWLKLFLVREEKELETLLQEAPNLNKAIVRLRNLSSDEVAKQIEEERLSSLSLRKTFEEEGRIKGRAEGLTQKAIEMTINMHKKGFDINTISEITEMPVEWVQSVIDNNKK